MFCLHDRSLNLLTLEKYPEKTLGISLPISGIYPESMIFLICWKRKMSKRNVTVRLWDQVLKKMADVIVLMILHNNKHNKTPVWAHNHYLFDEYKKASSKAEWHITESWYYILIMVDKRTTLTRTSHLLIPYDKKICGSCHETIPESEVGTGACCLCNCPKTFLMKKVSWASGDGLVVWLCCEQLSLWGALGLELTVFWLVALMVWGSQSIEAAAGPRGKVPRIEWTRSLCWPTGMSWQSATSSSVNRDRAFIDV